MCEFSQLTHNTGLSALDKRTPVRAKDTANRRSLNNTLTVLIRFALIGRNESDDSSSASSSSKSRSSDPSLSESSDTLRVHGIIQKFFVDTLIECKEAAFWVECAVNVFCQSYDSADNRIRQDPKVGLPEDYRRYSIHGKKLLDRLDQVERKHPPLVRARAALEERLKTIDVGIDALTKTLSTTIIRGRPDLVPMSIFEVANSYSDSDSTKTTSQDPMTWYDDGREMYFIPPNYAHFVESPVNDGHQIPYPPGNEFPMPKYPDDANMEGETKTPQPGSMSNSVLGLPTDPSHHRAVRRQDKRRYHDRAGSMRQTAGDHADPRVNVDQNPASGEISSPGSPASSSQQSPGTAARSQLLKISNSLSWRKTATPSSAKSSSFWSLLDKTFRKSPLASEASSMPPQQDTAHTPSSVALSPEGGLKGKGTLSPDIGAPSISRDTSHDSVTLQERMSRSDVVPGVGLYPVWDEEPRRGVSVPPSGQSRGYIADEDLMAFPPDQPPTDPRSVDMPSWPGSLQPTGYTSQPMSRQTSDNPAAIRARGSTPRSVPSGYATPRPRGRRLSQVETEPSPRLPFPDSGTFRNWEERHGREGGYGVSVPASRGRGRTIGTEFVRGPVLGDGPFPGGLMTAEGFVEFGREGGEARSGEVKDGKRQRDEDLRGVGLGILGGGMGGV